MVLLIIKRHTCLHAYTLCYFSLCSLSRETQSLGHLKTCLQVPVTRKTNPNKVLITNLNRNRRFWNTWMVFLHNSKCFLYFWWPRPFHLAISSAKGKVSGQRKAAPSQVQTMTLADPTYGYLRAASFIHSGRFVYSSDRFSWQPADQERKELPRMAGAEN